MEKGSSDDYDYSDSFINDDADHPSSTDDDDCMFFFSSYMFSVDLKLGTVSCKSSETSYCAFFS